VAIEKMSKHLAMNNYEKQRYELIASFFTGRKGDFLDVGCCRGGLKKFLGEDFAYHAVDFEDNDFESFVKVDLNHEPLPYEDATFDAANCSAVLEHLFYPLELLRELKRVLKDDGCLLVSLPNDKSLNAIYTQLFAKIESFDESIYGHHWRFSIETAREFFGKEFRIVKEAPEFGPLFRRYLPFLKWKRLGTEWFMLGVKK